MMDSKQSQALKRAAASPWTGTGTSTDNMEVAGLGQTKLVALLAKSRNAPATGKPNNHTSLIGREGTELEEEESHAPVVFEGFSTVRPRYQRVEPEAGYFISLEDRSWATYSWSTNEANLKDRFLRERRENNRQKRLAKSRGERAPYEGNEDDGQSSEDDLRDDPEAEDKAWLEGETEAWKAHNTRHRAAMEKLGGHSMDGGVGTDGMVQALEAEKRRRLWRASVVVSAARAIRRAKGGVVGPSMHPTTLEKARKASAEREAADVAEREAHDAGNGEGDALTLDFTQNMHDDGNIAVRGGMAVLDGVNAATGLVVGMGKGVGETVGAVAALPFGPPASADLDASIELRQGMNVAEALRRVSVELPMLQTNAACVKPPRSSSAPLLSTGQASPPCPAST